MSGDRIVRSGPRDPRRISGLTLILGATLISGTASYIVTWLVPRVIGFADYAAFAVFWSTIYLIVGALFGIQQEVTRATRPVDGTRAPQVNRARDFGIASGVVVFVLVVGTASLWQGVVFPVDGWALVFPLAVGAAGFVMVATLAGTLYGLAGWWGLAAMMVLDSVLRLAAIGVTLLFTDSTPALAWAVALPFPLVIVILWPLLRRTVVGRAQLDVGYRLLTWNVVRTIAAAAGTAAMVSGLPFLVGVTSHGERADRVGLIVLATTLVRAPLVIVAMSLQSYLVVRYRDHPDRVGRTVAAATVVGFAAGAVLALVGWLIGPAVFALLFPGQLVPSGSLIALLVLSSVLVATLCVVAPAVLARSTHVVYGAGWVAGAAGTVGGLLLPLDLDSRVVVAILAGPLLGLAIDGIYLAVVGRRSSPGSSAAGVESAPI